MKYAKIVLSVVVILSVTFMVSCKNVSDKPNTPKEPELSNKFDGTFVAVNGLFGDLPFIGYGMNNLLEKVTGEKRARPHYVSGRIAMELLTAHRDGTLKHPLVLVGHSLGGNAVTDIAYILGKEGVVVDYMVVVDAPVPREIGSNVRDVTNFLCSKLSCVGVPLNKGEEFTYDVDHIPLGNDERLHRYIFKKLNLKYKD